MNKIYFFDSYKYKSAEDLVGGIDFNGNGVEIGSVYKDSIIFHPNEYLFNFPDENSYIFVNDNKCNILPYVSTFYDNVKYKSEYKQKPLDELKLISPNVNELNLISAYPGDSYIGKYARGYFNRSVYLRSDFHRSRLFLGVDGDSSLIGYSWEIGTPDGSSKICSNYLEEGEFASDIEISRFNKDKKTSKISINDDIHISAFSGTVSLSLDRNGDFSIFSYRDKEPFSWVYFSSSEKKLDISVSDNSISINGEDSSINVRASNILFNATSFKIDSEIVAKKESIFNNDVKVEGLLHIAGDVDFSGVLAPGGGAFVDKAYTGVLAVKVNGVTLYIPLMPSA